MRNKLLLIFIAFGLIGCQESTVLLNEEIKWKKLYNVGKYESFCHLDSLRDGYVLAYHGRSVNRAGIVHIAEDLSNTKLFEKSKGEISDIQFTGNLIQMIYRDSGFNYELMNSKDEGRSWEQIGPVQFEPRKLAFWKSICVMDGRKSGAGNSQFMVSRDSGKTWFEIEVLPSYKSLVIQQGFDEFVLCIGNKDYNRNKFLVLFDIKRSALIDLIDMDGKSYVNVISRNKTEFALEEDGMLTIYSISDGSPKELRTLDVPNGLLWIENFYYNEKFSIVTGREEDLHGKIKSWIQVGQKGAWQPFYQSKGVKLVTNNISILAVIDDQGDVLVAE